MMTAFYLYRGDRLTRPELRGAYCDPVRRPDGKVIRGRNRNQLVRFVDGTLAVVAGRHLRRTDKLQATR